MEEMLEDPNLDKFRDQFEKLHGAWNDAKDSNVRLQNQNRQVNAELLANSSKVAQTLKQTQDDQVAIMQLKSELSKAWMMFDTANEKEQRLKEKCQQYKGVFSFEFAIVQPIKLELISPCVQLKTPI